MLPSMRNSPTKYGKAVERRPILLRLHLKGNAALAFPTSNSSDALSARRTEVFSSLQELGWGSKQPEGIEGPLGSGALKGETDLGGGRHAGLWR
jgi:hypothetical protein